jgi:hypothetical protein
MFAIPSKSCVSQGAHNKKTLRSQSEEAMERKVTASKMFISIIALFTSVSPYMADFNQTHVYNPYWPGHARFHNGHTMTLGMISGILSLYYLWIKRTSTAVENLKVSCLFAALYWMAMAPAILYPGATLNDPQQGGRPTDYIFGFAFTQFHIDGIIFCILALAYWREAKRLAL